VRDSAGRRVDPAAMDSVVSDTTGAPRPLRMSAPYNPARAARDTANLLQWSRAGCAIRLRRVTLYSGGEAMHLDFGMEVDSERRRGPSTFQIQAPRFERGTFRLRWDPAEPGGSSDDPQRLTQERWERAEAHPCGSPRREGAER
ncbi:MAG TPA: hypothetical protein VGB66_02660, partial [Longimicrobium sp.]